ncbi:hypothetical protein [Lentibacillus amyloliquefaciens]|uniref:Uncharacterized protein n=1 Tax=Lentibacillus amyloliquefaciens TaxID=1472767 RepID=A0A0U3W7L5_9BACI|nr:hypothetical protein [Lentibacillus amyloliquefaciens]ALX49090.1 hypothetical protein AOX59_11060 [Lentibacillus amyloliquefaciens]
MPVNLPAKQIYKLNFISSILFFLASAVTSLVTAVKFQTMLVLTLIVIIYWILAVTVTGLYKTSRNMKQIHLKTLISIVVITIVFAIQQLMFIKIPFSVSSSFFTLSFIFLTLLHTVYFQSKFHD